MSTSLDRFGTLVAAERPSERATAVVASVDCGWRKPDRRAFEAAACALGCPPESLVHGDDPAADGGVETVGGRAVRLAETALPNGPARLEAEPWA